jgi:hypothetical protein
MTITTIFIISYIVGWWLCSHILYFILDNTAPGEGFAHYPVFASIAVGMLWGIWGPFFILYYLIIKLPQVLIAWINKLIIRKKL